MKRLLLSFLALLLLAGCRGMYPDEYLSVNEHQAPFAYRETTTQAPETTEPGPARISVSRAYDIREGIQDLVISGQEKGQFLLKDYVGNVSEDMKNMFGFLLSDSPKYNYAMDSFDWYLSRDGENQLVNVEMQLRLTPQEVQDIDTLLFPNPALDALYRALRQQRSSFTLQVSGYQETDIVALLEDYILHNPNQVAEAPGISAAVYPDKGYLRVLELHFVYDTDRETLRLHREETASFLNLVQNQLSLNATPQEQVETLYKHLVPSFGYEADPEATVYSQVVKKIGSSRTMASVVEYLCGLAQLDCEIVEGLRGEEPWYWNRILVEGQWLHVDLHAAALAGETPTLTPAEAMSGYSWDPERYPEAETEAPPEETQEATQEATAETQEIPETTQE